MMVLIVIVLGITAFFRIPVDLLPDLTFPVAAIFTEYEGVGPEEIENSLTKLIEGTGWAAEEIGKTIDYLGEEIKKLGKML